MEVVLARDLAQQYLLHLSFREAVNALHVHLTDWRRLHQMDPKHEAARSEVASLHNLVVPHICHASVDSHKANRKPVVEGARNCDSSCSRVLNAPVRRIVHQIPTVDEDTVRLDHFLTGPPYRLNTPATIPGSGHSQQAQGDGCNQDIDFDGQHILGLVWFRGCNP